MDWEISVADYAKLKQQPGAPVLVDVREPLEVQMASIEGAVLMPMGEVKARAHQELDPDSHIAVLCHHGARSLSVTAWLRREGFEKVQSIAGGIDAWSREVDPTVPRY
ncbi:rhodanese-like domain-containing protein [Terriglobus tenax]|uniref:rhodanese-like domain-containing protein n=1 Tax=Terriglobus tenax TaxID=1111115 RepID=UPI0021E0962E|nr:rhodanese-like domain-containing protein [Terriglobus tenax]